MPTTTASEPPARVSEVQRERAVYRYLPPFAAPLIPKSNGENPESPKLSPKAFSSSDRALNAFAQLGALRLRARRVIISLIDRTHEYILAESTKTLSPQDDDVHDTGDFLWMGVRTIPRQESLCVAIMNTPRSNGRRSDTESRPKVIPKVINDLADDEILRYDPNIIGGPRFRFAATVPIRSRRGFDIGAYSVFDDIPRSGLAQEELEFLTDIADTVMEHLENIVVKKDHQRGEKMVKGLGLFVEGHSSIESWWLRTRHDRETSVRGHHSHATRSVKISQDHTNTSNLEPGKPKKKANSSLVGESRELDVPISSTAYSKARHDISIGPKVSDDQSSNIMPVGTSSHKSSVSELDQSSKPPPLILSNEAHFPTKVTEIPASEPLTRRVSDDAEVLRKMLSRASNLIRESTDVDGVIFFDAKNSGFGSQGHQSSSIKPQKTTHLHETGRISSSEDSPWTFSPNNTSDSSSSEKALDQESNKKVQNLQIHMCEVLAYSTALQSTLHDNSNLPAHMTVTEKFIRHLFKRHPHGKVYAFDGEGHMSSSEDELQEALPDGKISVIADASQTSSIRKASPRVFEGDTMLQIFPGARYVMILPLWDSQRERWFASTMLWTSDPTRVLSLDDDLNYVAAFGNSIMAEVSRLNMVASDQTKNALISSMSHELRSPLHGITSSIELLQDTQLSQYQMDIVNTIGHCSTTLLDTLNNVLDFAKINNFTAAQKNEQKAIRSSSRARNAFPAENFRIYGTISLTSDLDIASVTEDVINGIYAGHVYALQSTSSAGSDIDHSISLTKFGMQGTVTAPPLSVILDVDYTSNWTFKTQPGAWKRILMNIFGNALKFTMSGLVKVSLSYKSAASSKFRVNQGLVTLTISDTGKGIAADFLKHQIYAPFTQEDSLAPGAGLGLSIVRQIVRALDGKIEVHSIEGTGTVVKVVLKLEKSQSKIGETTLIPANIEKAKIYTDGSRLVLMGMEASIPESKKTDEAKSSHYGAIGLAISRISRNWFGMKTIEATEFDADMGDIFLVTSEKFYELEDNWKDLYSKSMSGSQKKHVIVLIASAPFDRRNLFENYQNIHFLRIPIGPKKLADCFISLFERPGVQDDDRFLTMPPNTRRTTSPLLKRTETMPPSLPNTDTFVLDNPIALLVEDNPINMKILIACMKKLNTQCYCAVNGLQAVSVYKNSKKKPDVIFMDISMPVMNGFEASQRIRGFEKTEKLRPTFIVAVTGLASDDSQREAYTSGINLFMSKPVPLKDLSNVVKDLERNRRLSVV